MKIYTEVIINMETNKVISEKSFDYNGPMALCGKSGGDSGLTAGQTTALNKQKTDVQDRKGDVKDYFSELKRLSDADFHLDQGKRLDSFLAESYNIGKKGELDMRKGKGLTDFSQMYESKVTEDLTKSEFKRSNDQANLKYMSDEMERNKGKFDQLAQLEDQLYQIETELES